jgi:hypothetical protein
MTKQELLTKKNLIIGGSVLAALLLLAYFLVLPGMQVNSYKSSVKTKHAELKSDVDEITAVLDSKALVSTDVEAVEVQAEAKKGHDAIKDAQHTLSLVEDDLTGFNALPLQFNSKYKDAKALKANEVKYIAETKGYIKELDELLTFLDKSSETQQASSSFQDEIALADENSETWPQYAEMAQPAFDKLVAALNDYEKLSVPASVKDLYDYDLKTSKELVELYKQEIAAAKADNEDQVFAVIDQEQTKTVEYATKMEELNSAFVKDSSLRKNVDKINELNRTIQGEIAKL